MASNYPRLEFSSGSCHRIEKLWQHSRVSWSTRSASLFPPLQPDTPQWRAAGVFTQSQSQLAQWQRIYVYSEIEFTSFGDASQKCTSRPSASLTVLKIGPGHTDYIIYKIRIRNKNIFLRHTWLTIRYFPLRGNTIFWGHEVERPTNFFLCFDEKLKYLFCHMLYLWLCYSMVYVAIFSGQHISQHSHIFRQQTFVCHIFNRQWLIVRDSLGCSSMGSLVYEMTGTH